MCRFFVFRTFGRKNCRNLIFGPPWRGVRKCGTTPPPLIRGVMTLNKMPKNFALMMKLGRTPKEDARIMPNLNLPTFHCLMTSKWRHRLDDVTRICQIDNRFSFCNKLSPVDDWPLIFYISWSSLQKNTFRLCQGTKMCWHQQFWSP